MGTTICAPSAMPSVEPSHEPTSNNNSNDNNKNFNDSSRQLLDNYLNSSSNIKTIGDKMLTTKCSINSFLGNSYKVVYTDEKGTFCYRIELFVNGKVSVDLTD